MGGGETEGTGGRRTEGTGGRGATGMGGRRNKAAAGQQGRKTMVDGAGCTKAERMDGGGEFREWK